MPRLAELQTRSEFPVHCPYPKVSFGANNYSTFIISCANLIIYSYDLPDDVFGPGEVKPTRPKKKTANKKRHVDANGAEVRSLLPLKKQRIEYERGLDATLLTTLAVMLGIAD